MTIDGNILDSEISLEKAFGKVSKGRQKKIFSGSTHSVSLFTPLSDSHSEEGKVVGRGRISGNIVGRAYVHPKEKVSLALRALKSDLSKSYSVRLKVWEDDLEEEGAWEL